MSPESARRPEIPTSSRISRTRPSNAIASHRTPYEDHLNQGLLIIRLSDGASWALKALWQVTVKPDGTVAVLVDETSISCM
jgi:hypothetical protein